MPSHPVVLAPEREEVVGCALAAVEIFTAPVVAPRLRVWLRVVQDGNAVLHRNPIRAELSGALRTGTPEQRREWARRLEGEGWRNMVTVDAAGERTRLLTLSCQYQDAVDAADPAGGAGSSSPCPCPRRGWRCSGGWWQRKPPRPLRPPPLRPQAGDGVAPRPPLGEGVGQEDQQVAVAGVAATDPPPSAR